MAGTFQTAGEELVSDRPIEWLALEVMQVLGDPLARCKVNGSRCRNGPIIGITKTEVRGWNFAKVGRVVDGPKRRQSGAKAAPMGRTDPVRLDTGRRAAATALQWLELIERVRRQSDSTTAPVERRRRLSTLDGAALPTVERRGTASRRTAPTETGPDPRTKRNQPAGIVNRIRRQQTKRRV